MPEEFKLTLFYVHDVFLHVYPCITCTPVACMAQKVALDPLELELQMAMSHYVGAENKSGISGRVAGAVNH